VSPAKPAHFHFCLDAKVEQKIKAAEELTSKLRLIALRKRTRTDFIGAQTAFTLTASLALFSYATCLPVGGFF
jgi:hypothetical protein